MRTFPFWFVSYIWLVGAAFLPESSTLSAKNDATTISNFSQVAPLGLRPIQPRVNGEEAEESLGPGHKRKRPDPTEKGSTVSFMQVDADVRRQISSHFTEINLMKVIRRLSPSRQLGFDRPGVAMQDLDIEMMYSAVSRFDGRSKIGIYANNPARWPTSSADHRSLPGSSSMEFRLSEKGWLNRDSISVVYRRLLQGLLPLNPQKVDDLTFDQAIAALQTSRLPFLSTQTKTGPWVFFNIQDYEIAPAGLLSGLCCHIEPLPMAGQRRGSVGVFISILRPIEIAQMEPSKDWLFPRNPWGWGKDNRHSPTEIGPFTWLEYLREGDRLLRSMGDGYYRSARLVEISMLIRTAATSGPAGEIHRFSFHGPRLFYEWHNNGQDWLVIFDNFDRSTQVEIPLSSAAQKSWLGWGRIPSVGPYYSVRAKQLLGMGLWAIQGTGQSASIDLQTEDLATTPPSAIALWLSLYQEGLSTPVDWLSILHIPHDIHPHVDDQDIFFFRSSMSFIASRSGIAMRRPPWSNKWEPIYSPSIQGPNDQT